MRTEIVVLGGDRDSALDDAENGVVVVPEVTWNDSTADQGPSVECMRHSCQSFLCTELD